MDDGNDDDDDDDDDDDEIWEIIASGWFCYKDKLCIKLVSITQIYRNISRCTVNKTYKLLIYCSLYIK